MTRWAHDNTKPSPGHQNLGRAFLRPPKRSETAGELYSATAGQENSGISDSSLSTVGISLVPAWTSAMIS